MPPAARSYGRVQPSSDPGRTDKGSSSKKRFSSGRLPDGPHRLQPLRPPAESLICFPFQGILFARGPTDFRTKLLTRSQLMFTFGARKPRSQEFKLTSPQRLNSRTTASAVRRPPPFSPKSLITRSISPTILTLRLGLSYSFQTESAILSGTALP